MAHIKQQALSDGYVTTIAGCRRPIRSLPDQALGSDAGQAKRAAGEADRKAVNSTIQGSAADLIKLAMCQWAHSPAANPSTGEAISVAGPALWVSAYICQSQHWGCFSRRTCFVGECIHVPISALGLSYLQDLLCG